MYHECGFTYRHTHTPPPAPYVRHAGREGPALLSCVGAEPGAGVGARDWEQQLSLTPTAVTLKHCHQLTEHCHWQREHSENQNLRLD